jgi:hypothetical protein
MTTRHNTNFRSTGRVQHLQQTLKASSNEGHEIPDSRNRRQVMHLVIGLGVGLPFLSENSRGALALDMDAFMNSQVSL